MSFVCRVAGIVAERSLPRRYRIIIIIIIIFAQETGYSLSDDELNRAFLRFKDLADKKKEITSLDLASIVNDEIRDLNLRRFELVGMQVMQCSSAWVTSRHGLLLTGLFFAGGDSRRRWRWWRRSCLLWREISNRARC